PQAAFARTRATLVHDAVAGLACIRMGETRKLHGQRPGQVLPGHAYPVERSPLAGFRPSRAKGGADRGKYPAGLRGCQSLLGTPARRPRGQRARLARGDAALLRQGLHAGSLRQASLRPARFDPGKDLAWTLAARGEEFAQYRSGRLFADAGIDIGPVQ